MSMRDIALFLCLVWFGLVWNVRIRMTPGSLDTPFLVKLVSNSHVQIDSKGN